MTTAIKEDLQYSADVLIPLIQVVYDRYQNGTSAISLPNIQAIADIHADTHRLSEVKREPYPSSAKLMEDMYDPRAAEPTLMGTISFDPATSTAIISFRGTEKVTEWLDDFKGNPFPFSDLGAPVPWVHKGFLDVWNLASASVSAGMSGLPAVNRLLTTGHSLGSATASLCAIKLASELSNQTIACWTFASPRVFFGRPKRFNAAISSSLRVFNPADIVTNVPPLPFIHVAGGIAINAVSEQPHSLWNTYLPGVLALAHDSEAVKVALEPSEDELLDLAHNISDGEALRKEMAGLGITI